jgi:hypothetical protein
MDRHVTLVGLVACTAHVALDDFLTPAATGSTLLSSSLLPGGGLVAVVVLFVL